MAPRNLGEKVGVDIRVGVLEEGHKRIENYVIGIAIVSVIAILTLYVSVAGMWRDSNQFKSETYQVLVDKVNILIAQNEQQQKVTKDQEIQDLQNQILELKQKNYLK